MRVEWLILIHYIKKCCSLQGMVNLPCSWLKEEQHFAEATIRPGGRGGAGGREEKTTIQISSGRMDKFKSVDIAGLISSSSAVLPQCQ